jgi:DNA helicase-2/ATP-dependent DNA helicase PcrA
MFKLSEQKIRLLDTDGHILVLGGPGSGKTTIALLKAKGVIEKGMKYAQYVVFLSFARATVARIEQKTAELRISKLIRQHLEIGTYHGFSWNILRSHGYLLNNKSPLQLLPPPEAASRLANIVDNKEREMEKLRLFEQEGLLHFDLFAGLSAELLSRSRSLTAILCDTYPVIILDEFQDTNADEWNLICTLGKHSKLIALADPEQRIYEFRGADPARIGEFISTFNPTVFDFGSENNRSNGKDIVQFGNDLLTGANKRRSYNDVKCIDYPFRKGTGVHWTLKCQVLNCCKRLRDTEQGNWSLAVLVPTKRLMLDVSDFLASKQELSNGKTLPEIDHEVALETAGPSLAAVLIGGLMEGGKTDQEIANRLIHDLSEYIRGRKGDEPASKTDIELSNALIVSVKTGKVRGKNRKLVISECLKIAAECGKINFSGDPAHDWLIVRKILHDSECDVIRQVALDAQYLRLLHRGAQLRSSLGVLWRNNGTYFGATQAVRNALLQEHFSASTRVWRGIHVMTMHKAKGKEFDEVIIYEGYYQGKIVRDNATDKEINQSRLKLRVAVTRAIKRTTILSPRNQICRFL